jgi:hypothetical protein
MSPDIAVALRIKAINFNPAARTRLNTNTVPVQVGVADVEPEGPGRGACGGLVDLGCP